MRYVTSRCKFTDDHFPRVAAHIEATEEALRKSPESRRSTARSVHLASRYLPLTRASAHRARKHPRILMQPIGCFFGDGMHGARPRIGSSLDFICTSFLPDELSPLTSQWSVFPIRGNGLLAVCTRRRLVYQIFARWRVTPSGNHGLQLLTNILFDRCPR